VIPLPVQGLGGMITACWAKPHCTNFFWEKYSFMNVDGYGPLCLKYVYFWASNIYTVLEQRMQPASWEFSNHVFIHHISSVFSKFFSTYLIICNYKCAKPCLTKLHWVTSFCRMHLMPYWVVNQTVHILLLS